MLYHDVVYKKKSNMFNFVRYCTKLTNHIKANNALSVSKNNFSFLVVTCKYKAFLYIKCDDKKRTTDIVLCKLPCDIIQKFDVNNYLIIIFMFYL